VLFTGGYIGTTPSPLPKDDRLRGVPALLRSIEHDPWVPKHRVEETAGLLRAAGLEVDVRIDPGDEHIITNEACESATKLLAALAVGG